MKYLILADSNWKSTEMIRQLSVIGGERLVDRTIRLLKENGVKDILISSKNKKFDECGKRYEPLHNDYDGTHGYWLSAFPIELLDEPICFIWGDVYFSEEAIKTIVNTDTESTMFFCTDKRKGLSKDYIKEHDEPFAYKVVDTDLFKKHIEKVKRMYDKGLTIRHPIVWEVYRSINGQNVNVHLLTKNYTAINDITCDIDSIVDIVRLENIVGGKTMVRVEALEVFTLNEKMYSQVKEKLYSSPEEVEEQKFNIGDKFICPNEIAGYLMNELDKNGNKGNNPANRQLVKVIEVIPEKISVNEEVSQKPKKRTTKKSK